MININIVESPEFLSNLLENESDVKRFHKLRMLYFLKTQKIKSLRQIAQILGRHRSTVQKWIRHYQQGGLPKLMEDYSIRFAKIPTWVVDRLIQEFQDAQFLPPIREIQSWVQRELKVEIGYGQLQKLLKFKVNPIHNLNLDDSTNFGKFPLGSLSSLQLNSDIQECFDTWKNDRGLPSESQAINQLVGEFFNLRQTHRVNPLQQPGITLIEALEKNELILTIPYNIPDLLIQNRLAERLRVHNSVLCRERWRRTFPGWAKQRDPDGVGWLWFPELRKYRPLLSWEEIRTVLLAPAHKRQLNAST